MHVGSISGTSLENMVCTPACHRIFVHHACKAKPSRYHVKINFTNHISLFLTDGKFLPFLFFLHGVLLRAKFTR
jgi:hypothetical protein